MKARYNEKVMEHFRNPRNVGIIRDADGIGSVGDPSWGIDMELYIKVKGGTIIDAKFKTFGCGTSIAASSVITEMIKGKSVEEALQIPAQAINEALDGLPADKKHCASMGQELIKSAVSDYLVKRERQEQ